MIWEERTEQQKLSTAIVSPLTAPHSFIQREVDKKKEGVYKCVYSPTSFPFNAEIHDDPLPLHRWLWKFQCTLFCSRLEPKSGLFPLPSLTFISHQHNLIWWIQRPKGQTLPPSTNSSWHLKCSTRLMLLSPWTEFFMLQPHTLIYVQKWCTHHFLCLLLKCIESDHVLAFPSLKKALHLHR